MNKIHENKCHVCRFCKQSFTNGKKLGGHMRGHLALISASRNKSTQESNQEISNGEKGFSFDDAGNQIIEKIQSLDQDYDAISRKQSIQEIINGEKGFDSDDDMIKKSQQANDVDQDNAGNVYVLRENPKRSWRISNSSKDYGNICKKNSKGFHSSKPLANHKKTCQSSKESIKNAVCEQCGKGFDSVKALYGHMRCHSIKRSRPLEESYTLSSSSKQHYDEGVANPVRKKRSCTRYKSPKPNNLCTSLSSCDDDYDEAEQGAICLMMISRGVRNLNGVKLSNSNQTEFAFSNFEYSKIVKKNVEFEVSVGGSMEFCEFKNKSKLGLKKVSIDGCWSGQFNPGNDQSTLLKYKSTKKPRSCDEDFGERDATVSEIPLELKRRLKDHNCPICFKKFGSGQALGRHKRVHYKTEIQALESVDLNIMDGGINNGDMEFKLSWVHNDIKWDPLTM